MSLPRVSVVIPAFRQAAFVTACLESVARQSYQGPIEPIVIDDGCPQGTGAVAMRHRLAPKVVHQQNAGVASARNRGIREATGDYVAFLDADDRWLDDKLERVMARLLASEPALAFTRYRRVDPDGNPVGAAVHPSPEVDATLRGLARMNFIGCSTVVVHRACLERTGGFPDSAELRRGGQDYALWLRIAARHPLIYVPEVLTEYLVHPGSRVGADAIKNFEGAVFALRSFRSWEPREFGVAVQSTYRRLVLRHASYMIKDLVRQRAAGAALRRATGALALALLRAR